MDPLKFLAGAAIATGGLMYLRSKRASEYTKREEHFQTMSKNHVYTAPYFSTGPETEIEHLNVPHLREYFPDLETFDR